jgi:hypothetical protein
VTGRLDQLRGGEARIPGRLGELLGAAPDVAGMSGVGRDRGDTAEFDQFIDEARLMGVAVGVEIPSVHGLWSLARGTASPLRRAQPPPVV